MFVLGLLLLLLGYFFPIPPFLITIAWLLVVVGLILLLAEGIGHAISPRRWY
jgi:ribose/xylose/arabinose/galactoside ABC-type transport system permease subunit